MIAQISFLDYVGGDHQVAAVGKSDSVVLILGSSHLFHQRSRHKERC
jgi:hypothetical protein